MSVGAPQEGTRHAQQDANSIDSQTLSVEEKQIPAVGSDRVAKGGWVGRISGILYRSDGERPLLAEPPAE